MEREFGPIRRREYRAPVVNAAEDPAVLQPKRQTLIVDGYRVRGNQGEKGDYHNIHVVYTKEHETADAYIERLANDIGRNESVRVVTSDSLIRLSALRSGVLRTSAKEFQGETAGVLARIEQAIEDLKRT